MTQAPASLPATAAAAIHAPLVSPARAVGLYLPTMTLWQREMVRFFRQRNRVMSSVVTPILMWLMLGFGLNQSFMHPVTTGDTTQSVGYAVYFFPGTVTMILLFTAIFSTITVIEDRREGFLQGVLVSPAPRLAIALGKVLGGASIAMIQALVFLLIWPLATDDFNIGLMLAAVPVMAVLAVMLTALGVCVAWPMDSTAGFHAVMMIFLMPMWFLSGAVFPVSTAPTALKAIMLANPLTYGHDVLATVLTGGRAATGVPLPAHLILSSIITLLVTAGLVWLAARMVSRPRRDGLP